MNYSVYVTLYLEGRDNGWWMAKNGSPDTGIIWSKSAFPRILPEWCGIFFVLFRFPTHATRYWFAWEVMKLGQGQELAAINMEEVCGTCPLFPPPWAVFYFCFPTRYVFLLHIYVRWTTEWNLNRRVLLRNLLRQH